MDDLEKGIAGMDFKDDNGPTCGGNGRVQKDDGTTFTQDGPTFGGSAHIVKDDGPTFGSTEWKQHIDKLIAESDKTPALGTLLATRARFDPDHYKPWGRAWDKRYKEEWMKRHADRVEDVEKVKKSLNIATGAAGA